MPTVVKASALFVGTNLDDITLLVVLYASSRLGGRPTTSQIWRGQFVGIAILVGLSLLAALGLKVVPDGLTWLLGLIPLGLGLYKLSAALRAHQSGERPSATLLTSTVAVAAMTVANGGDNIAAYTAVFRTSTAGAIVLTIGVFALGVFVWCALGAWLVSSRRILAGIQRWEHWIVPAVFILIGLSIVGQAGSFF